MKIDLTCPVELWQYAMPTEDDAECTFVMNNLSDKVVVSVQVTLACFDKEDQLLFRQTERIQGLKAGVGERFSIMLLPSQWRDVEGVDVVIEKVWFDDASVWRKGNAPLAFYTPNVLPAGRGLDELRFNLGASGCADKVIGLMATAKKYIPQVGVETPMTPAFYKAFLQKKQAILDTGVDFINCAELHLNPNNIDNYAGESLYLCRQGYVSPIWSREITFAIMRMAAQEGWDMVVHDCSNHTKFARDLNLRAKEGGWFGASSYGCEFDRMPYEAFLPVLQDDTLPFLEEEELPHGYRPGELVL